MEDGVITEEEFGTILDAFRAACVQDVEARPRVRQASLVPLAAAVSALTAHGHTEKTSAILRELKSLPRSWRLQEEKEKLEKNNEVCVLSVHVRWKRVASKLSSVFPLTLCTDGPSP